jgi:transcription termination/antitermination protein NusA
MKSEIIDAFHQIVKEKNIDKELLSEIIENTILSIIKKKYGTADNFDIFVSMDKGEIEIYQYKTIVEEVTEEATQIDLDTARAVEPDLELGDEYVEVINPLSFGRRLVTAAKQNLNQKIRDAEKEIVFDEFKNRIGEIVIGDIRQLNKNEIFLNIERVEVVLPKSEQIYNERYRRGEHIRTVIKDVVRTNRGPEIIVSRASVDFLVRLFEIEVPEIYDGIIEVKSVAREAGDRTKIAVYSNDKRIDAVGACVGMKGIRIQSIVKELNNEKIDIINWNAEPEIFIMRALSPAKPVKVIVDSEAGNAVAVIPDDQISLAIGKGGQNKRLASKLSGFEINTIKESEYHEMVSEERKEILDLTQIDGLAPSVVNKLHAQGLETVEDILNFGYDNLIKIPGIADKTATKILDILNKL